VKLGFRQAILQMLNPELKSVMNYNPANVLKNITCSVLALNGENDLQVPADINLNRVKELVKNSATIKKYIGLNHLFQHCETGLPNRYGEIEETIAPQVLDDIANWILQHTK
jgi:fermentation-respiration switch protein FrsA (DUF1100 family)